MIHNSGESKKPIKILRIGLIRASIFDRDTQNSTFYATSFSRSYKDGKDWKYTDSFGVEDLPVIEKLAEGGLRWILQKQGEETRRTGND